MRREEEKQKGSRRKGREAENRSKRKVAKRKNEEETERRNRALLRFLILDLFFFFQYVGGLGSTYDNPTNTYYAALYDVTFTNCTLAVINVESGKKKPTSNIFIFEI